MKTKKLMMVAACFVLAGWSGGAQNVFDTYFEKKSLRVDFALSGNMEFQAAALIRMREEPVWGGPVHNLIDTSCYGGYYVKVFDKASGELIFSRGFNTLFEEWRATEQAEKEVQSWANSVSVPFPRREVTFELSGRNRADMLFSTMLKVDIEPSVMFIDRGRLRDNKVTRIQYAGEPSGKVDLVFLAEGYTEAGQDKFVADARRFTEALFATPPFDSRRDDFNVWSVGLVSEEEGTDIPGRGVFRNTALNSGFYTFGMDRYLTTQDMTPVRDAVWNVPCDAIFILVNSDMYGGGGMYNFYAMGTADNERTASVFVHELGHSFAGLADEYFSSEVAYDTGFYPDGLEPWEPNISTLVNFSLKWEDMLPAGTPVPTPPEETYVGETGVFEGGGYRARGVYRPRVHCMMRDYAAFCPVCSRAIVRMIDSVSDKR
ncbi:MAG: IgA Peptidase M64 [Tannerellaceae bacterium]|nr:IgA Peptidase M64 [Tannerellaceae bacterium]